MIKIQGKSILDFFILHLHFSFLIKGSSNLFIMAIHIEADYQINYIKLVVKEC